MEVLRTSEGFSYFYFLSGTATRDGAVLSLNLSYSDAQSPVANHDGPGMSKKSPMLFETSKFHVCGNRKMPPVILEIHYTLVNL